jgi:putative hemolysin
MRASQVTVSFGLPQSITEMAVLPDVRNEKAAQTMPRLSLGLATGSSDIAAAQRLRHRVFIEEMGARANVHSHGQEHDFFDPWCEHLIVRDETSGDVVGTNRLLTPENARRLGTYCAEREFDLTRLGRLRHQLVEVGRACVDPAYRTGPAVMLLWSGIAKFARERGASYLIGCASISMADRGANAAAVYAQLARRYLAPPEYRVVPRSPLAALVDPLMPSWTIPPLIKAYLRLGAWIGGEPAWDPDFDMADLLIFLPITRAEERHARHFLHERQAA